MPDSSPCRLIQPLTPHATVPSLHRHYSDFITTTDCSAPVPDIGTRLLAGSPLEALPWHPDDRFSCSTIKPDTGSRRLYAGCRLVGNQVSTKLVPSDNQQRVLTSTESLSAPRQRFTCVRLRRTSPNVSSTPFPRTLPALTLYQHCSEVVCDLLLKDDRGGPSSIFMTARLFLSLHDTLVILDHTAPTRLRAPTLVHSPYFSAAHTARRRAEVGTRRNGSS